MLRNTRTKGRGKTRRSISAKLRERLTRIADEVARGQNMPSMREPEHEFRRATPPSDRRHVIEDAERANDQCQQWALELLGLVDLIAPSRVRS